MKYKKIALVICTIAIVVIIVTVTVYLIDINRMRNNKPVLFSTWGYDYVPPIAYTEPTNSIYSFIGTVLEETTKYMIVEPAEDEEERKSSDKIQVNYNNDHTDYLYGIGRKVLITYNGVILETYPAQIYSDDIRTDGYSNFIMSVVKSEIVEKKKALNNKELYEMNSDYNLYYYGLDKVNVIVNNEFMPLEKALREGKVTIEGIIAKANKEAENESISRETYRDGGTMWYDYGTYTVLKRHTLDGDRDVYIGIPEMRNNF